MWPEHWKLCNCAACGEELLGESQKNDRTIRCVRVRPDFVYERINGRPLCIACFGEVARQRPRDARAGRLASVAE
jgi:hypothetical protein